MCCRNALGISNFAVAAQTAPVFCHSVLSRSGLSRRFVWASADRQTSILSL